MSRHSSLQFRLSIWFGLVMGTVCAMLIGYFAWVTRAESLDKARGILLASAHREAGRLEGQLNKAMDVARVVAQSFGALTQAPGSGSRAEAHTLMRSILEQNPDFLDLFSVWEPDAFDGSDARFAGTPGHDRTGRFIPVWNRARDGSIHCEPARFYDTPGKGDYYLLPLRSGRECLLEPYEYPLRGEKVFMTSLVVPILRQGRSVGIVGVDYRLGYLQHLADQVHLYGGAGRLYILSQGGVVAGATGQAERVGHTQEAGQAFSLPGGGAREGVFTSRGSILAFTTIQVGSAAERWTVVLTVPSHLTTAEADRRIALLVAGASAFCLLGIVASLLLIRHKVVRNIQRLTQATEDLALGAEPDDLDIPGKDELHRLAVAFNLMTRRIAASVRALKDSENLRREAIDYSVHFFSVLSPGGDLEFANRTALEAIGAPLESVAGRPFWDLAWWSHSEEAQAMIRRGVAEAVGGTVFHSKASYLGEGGQLKKADFFISPLRDSQGQITHLLAEGRDVTEELLMREALEASEARYRQIVEDSPIGVFRLRLDGPFEFSNRVTLRQFECDSLEQLNERYGNPAARWPSLDAYADYKKEILATGKVMGREVAVRLVDGKPKFHAIFAYLDRDQGLISGFLVDITERKRLSEQLAQAQKMEAIGQLAGGVAHDFNNSLAGIIGAAEVLRYEAGAVEKRENLLDLIILAAERAGKLTQKLLAFSRKAPKASSPVDVLAIVKDVTEILARTLDRNIQIRVDAQAANTWVVGDDALLQNAFLNLGINAGHAMPAGGALGFKLMTRTLDGAFCDAVPFDLAPGDFLEIEVRDTGTGMSPEVRDRIFEPFFTTKEQGKGTGLGLSAVYGSVQDHHGAITVDSEPGRGTTFHIYLPLASRDQVTPAATALPEEGTGTLLFIDDDDLLRVTGRAMLERLGYTVFTAEDGRAGIELFRARKGQIDLILLDMIMPAMGGREALARIRDLDPDIPVVMCSGFSKGDDLANLGEYALAGFLHKPFRGVELAQVVARALRR